MANEGRTLKGDIEKKVKDMDPKEKKVVFEVFILLFPSLITTCIAAAFSSVALSLVSIVLFFYQATMLKRYIETKMN